jgi:hypothetical protein
VLDLDDSRWMDLDHRNWSHGRRSSDDPDIPFVPDELRLLTANPADRDRFEDLWPYLASEDTAWPAALTLLTEQLATPQKHIDTRYLLAATAALKGHVALGGFLNDLDFYAECRSCGEPVLDVETDPGNGLLRLDEE